MSYLSSLIFIENSIFAAINYELYLEMIGIIKHTIILFWLI